MISNKNKKGKIHIGKNLVTNNILWLCASQHINVSVFDLTVFAVCVISFVQKV